MSAHRAEKKCKLSSNTSSAKMPNALWYDSFCAVVSENTMFSVSSCTISSSTTTVVVSFSGVSTSTTGGNRAL